jgi:hypothetical protein
VAASVDQHATLEVFADLVGELGQPGGVLGLHARGSLDLYALTTSMTVGLGFLILIVT